MVVQVVQVVPAVAVVVEKQLSLGIFRIEKNNAPSTVGLGNLCPFHVCDGMFDTLGSAVS